MLVVKEDSDFDHGQVVSEVGRDLLQVFWNWELSRGNSFGQGFSTIFHHWPMKEPF